MKRLIATTAPSGTGVRARTAIPSSSGRPVSASLRTRQPGSSRGRCSSMPSASESPIRTTVRRVVGRRRRGIASAAAPAGGEQGEEDGAAPRAGHRGGS
ncbi:MAG TPA: hypothetical protein VGW75_14995 [Solirubrobacteraceae bacterium]|nr:hypothetical protein [Solirubrobacteraceae bacterium]